MIPLSQAQPPERDSVLRVDQKHPLPAELEGQQVWIVAVLERTAVFERPGRDIRAEGRELVNQTRLLVDPVGLVWVESPAPFWPASIRSTRMQQSRHCRDCGRTPGQVRFANGRARCCLECEEKQA